jgi:hypothetical protein
VNYPDTFISITAITDRSTIPPVLKITSEIIRVLEALYKENPLTDSTVFVSVLPGFHPEHSLDLVQPLRLNQTDNHRFRLSSPVR